MAALVAALVAAVHYPVFDQRAHNRAGQSSMQAKIALFAQCSYDRLRYLAHTELYRIAVVNELGGMPRDAPRNLIGLRDLDLRQRIIDLDDIIDLVGCERWPVGDTRHCLVDLRDHGSAKRQYIGYEIG